MYLTRHDTELVKTVITRAWETYCVITIVLCCIFPGAVWFSSLLVVMVWGSFRLFRRYPRRHDKCAKKGIFHGWFFRKQYYRTTPRVAPREEVRIIDVVLGKQKLPHDDRDECRFECCCLECGELYEVKPPELKSFEHRSKFFQWW